MKKNKFELKLVIAGIVLFVFCVATSFFWYQIFKTDKVVVTNLTISMKDRGKGVDIQNLVPQTDQEAKKVPAYSFDISNNSDVDGRYEVLIEDSVKKDSDGYESVYLLPRDQLKYELILNGKVVASDLLSKVKNNVLDTRVIDAHKTNNYSLRIWIPFNANNWQNKTYHYKIAIHPVNKGE